MVVPKLGRCGQGPGCWSQCRHVWQYVCWNRRNPGEIVKFNQKATSFITAPVPIRWRFPEIKKGDFGKLAKHQTTRVEGAEGLVLHKGPVAKVIDQLTGGISSGLSYCGAHNIKQLRKNAEFILVTANGIRENSHHDVIV